MEPTRAAHFSNGAQPKHDTDLIDNTLFSRPPPEYLALDGTSSCEQRRNKAFSAIARSPTTQGKTTYYMVYTLCKVRHPIGV